MRSPIQKSITLEDGKTLSLETGKLARLAHGSVLLRAEDTVLLATVVAKDETEEEPNFLPLSVDYQERFAATGKIPGGFFKREGKLSDYEVLISRLVDRAVRPLFPEDYFVSTQINITLLSASLETLPDAYAALAASTALMLSNIPFQGPISEVRVAKIDGDYIINPSHEALQKANLDLIVAASEKNILMVEGECKEVPESDIIEAIRRAHEVIRKQCALQMELVQAVGSTKPKAYLSPPADNALYEKMKKSLPPKIEKVARSAMKDKLTRHHAFDEIKSEFLQSIDSEEVSKYLVDQYFKKILKDVLRNTVLQTKQRLDGRSPEDIRPITIDVDYLPNAHGSALFTRGETQSLTTATLGTKLDEQMIDGAVFSDSKKFMLHYNFPGFSTGEVKPNRGPSRREVGHGNLASRALKHILPSEENNPYTLRLVSDILESNGSSSMATVCAGSLALMDAGIRTKSAVAGIAMGLISQDKNYVILSDILGDEDQLGDMDFKITGTKDGITACQMDIKLEGLSFEILEEALLQARKGLVHIIDAMDSVLSAPRENYKANAPRMEKIIINKEMIGAVIGPGGKVIQEIQRTSGAKVNIEEVNGQGEISICAQSTESLDRARDHIKSIVALPEVDSIYEGKVESIMPYGAFIEFLPNKTGLLHISEISWERLENMEGIFQQGDSVRVKLIDIDRKTGKYRLSRKVLLKK